MKNKKNIKYYSLLLISIIIISCSNNPSQSTIISNEDTNSILLTPNDLPTDTFVESNSIKIVAKEAFNNLQIFMLAGENSITNKKYISLTKALELKYSTVEETGSVNELSITNHSEHYIFIHAGDIVKGGRQDRTISYDVIIPPYAKKIPLTSFCVESARWQKRGNESVSEFSANDNILSSRKLKVASKAQGNQSEVWKEVSEQQSKLNSNVSYFADKNIDVTSNSSGSSLQLSLENEDLDSIKNSYRIHFEYLINEFPESTGFAYAINGEVYGIELYNSKDLFIDLWGKLLNACIIESISERNDSTYTSAYNKDVFEILTNLMQAKQTKKNINSETSLITSTTKEAMLFTTIDRELNNWVHKNYIAIDSSMNNEVNKTRNIEVQDIELNSYWSLLNLNNIEVLAHIFAKAKIVSKPYFYCL